MLTGAHLIEVLGVNYRDEMPVDWNAKRYYMSCIV